VRFYGDDDYAAMARAFSDAARAVETADNEVSSLVEAAVAKAREAQGTHEDPAFPDGENIELQQRLVEQQQKTEQEKP
jgi:hypothetical protein